VRITEKEAKFLFCPLLTTGDGKMRFCQASQCMMWRWAGAGEHDATAGFCGLAGAPVAAARCAKAAPFGNAPSKKDVDDPFA